MAKEESKKEGGSCFECKWYDLSTQRRFDRFGIKAGLTETRAICRNMDKSKTKAGGHLVKRESIRPCFERGVYTVLEKEVVAPVKEEKPKKVKVKKVKTEPKVEEPVEEKEKDYVEEAVELRQNFEEKPKEEENSARGKKKGRHVEKAVNILSGQEKTLVTLENGKTYVK